MARKGFLIGIHRLATQVARENERQRKLSQRAYEAALRESEAARRREHQAYAQRQKASVSEMKRLEKEAKEAHEAAMAAEVDCRNLKLASQEEDLNNILQATMGFDNFVDLNFLRVQAEHPPFHRPELTKSCRPPLPLVDAPMPRYADPPTPSGFLSFLTKSSFEKKKQLVFARHQDELTRWRNEVLKNEERRAFEAIEYEQREQKRLEILAQEQASYAAECAQRDQEAETRNREVDELIANLAYGVPDAIEEYIGIELVPKVRPSSGQVKLWCPVRPFC